MRPVISCPQPHRRKVLHRSQAAPTQQSTTLFASRTLAHVCTVPDLIFSQTPLQSSTKGSAPADSSMRTGAGCALSAARCSAVRPHRSACATAEPALSSACRHSSWPDAAATISGVHLARQAPDPQGRCCTLQTRQVGSCADRAIGLWCATRSQMTMTTALAHPVTTSSYSRYWFLKVLGGPCTCCGSRASSSCNAAA